MYHHRGTSHLAKLFLIIKKTNGYTTIALAQFLL
jgi:hypothetical protein